MGRTKIEWTDLTWNPLRGCSRVSEGCRNCYAEGQAVRFAGKGGSYEGLAIMQNGHPHWTGKVELVEKRLLDPLKCKPGFSILDVDGNLVGRDVRRPLRFFVNSMSDLFHEVVPDEWIDKIFAVMALCPQHTFQVLTKRPKRMLEYLSQVLDEKDMQRWANAAGDLPIDCRLPYNIHERDWPLSNVWLGVSVENQAAADERIPLLLKTPAAVRFVSAEPLLGPITLEIGMVNGLPIYGHQPGRNPWARDITNWSRSQQWLDWVICGGESGPGARPMHPDWARSLRDQCKAAGVPFFFKQWGEWVPFGQAPNGALIGAALDQALDWPMYRVGKKAAGALLDGVEHRAFPMVRP